MTQPKMEKIGQSRTNIDCPICPDAAASEPFANDLAGMTDSDIEREIQAQTDAMNEIEDWLEALHAEQRLRKSR